MRKYFSRLQWKLTLSYALVTTATVLLLAALLVFIAIVAQTMSSNRLFDSYYWSKTGFQDNIPQLQDDPKALLAWLERVQQEGFLASDFQNSNSRHSLDYANSFIPGTPVYVLAPDLNLLAAAPLSDPANLGKPFGVHKINGINLDPLLEAALVGDKNYPAQVLRLSSGVRLAAFPLRKNDEAPVTAIVVYMLKPKTFAVPENLEVYSLFFLVTAVIMFAVALPVGAVFGWLASRGLRWRLANLSTASQAWSKGNFSIYPQDRSGDEIGDLTRNLNRMAVQLQSLMQTRDELARVEERNRLARDLHDTIKQQTYAARMQLNAVKNLLPADLPAASEHLEVALQLNRETQQELKLIIDELRPAALEGRSLAQALIEYVDRWQEHTGIKVNRTILGEGALPLEVEKAFFRVLQEALSNIARHALADSTVIRLKLTPEQASLQIEDNGRGFDKSTVSPNSFGLVSMQQRMEEVGGYLKVESTPSEGTKVLAEVNFTNEKGKKPE